MKIYVAYYWYRPKYSSSDDELKIGMISTYRANVEKFAAENPQRQDGKLRNWQIEEIKDGEEWPDLL